MLDNSKLEFILDFSESDKEKETIFINSKKKYKKRKNYINQILKNYGFKYLKFRKRLISI